MSVLLDLCIYVTLPLQDKFPEINISDGELIVKRGYVFINSIIICLGAGEWLSCYVYVRDIRVCVCLLSQSDIRVCVSSITKL